MANQKEIGEVLIELKTQLYDDSNTEPLKNLLQKSTILSFSIDDIITGIALLADEQVTGVQSIDILNDMKTSGQRTALL